MPTERRKVISNFTGKMIGEFGISIALLIEVILFSQLSPYFFTAENILNVSLQISITASNGPAAPKGRADWKCWVAI